MYAFFYVLDLFLIFYEIKNTKTKKNMYIFMLFFVFYYFVFIVFSKEKTEEKTLKTPKNNYIIKKTKNVIKYKKGFFFFRKNIENT